jgi:hypothetical protein
MKVQIMEREKVSRAIEMENSMTYVSECTYTFSQPLLSNG